MLSELLKFYIWIIVAHSISAETNGLRLTNLTIPSHNNLKDPAVLSCNFELGHGKLYSVKWYKDEFEFFRYMPENMPPFQAFPLNGVNLDLSRSNETVVTLNPLNFNTTGSYRCEVSTDGPNFETVYRNGNMTVIVLPQHNPSIEGIQKSYNLGDYLTVNCTSAHSNPVAELSWYINSNKADSWLVEKYPIVTTDEYLHSRTLGLRFQLNREHFQNKENSLKLQCVATVDGVGALQSNITILSPYHHENIVVKPAVDRYSNNFGTQNYPPILLLILILARDSFYVSIFFV